MPPGGADQVTKQGGDRHARESTSFAGSRLSVIHRGGQAALVPEAEEPLDDEDPDVPDDPEDDEPDEDEPEEPDEDDDVEDDDSALAGTEPLPDDRLSLR